LKTKNLLPENLKSNNFLKFLFGLMVIVSVTNVFSYYHELGYDGQHHKWYIEVLPNNLPTEQDTKEFFSPPLPYLVPSIVDKFCDKSIEFDLIETNCSIVYGNAGQIFQVFLLLLTFIVLCKIVEIIFPKNNEFANATLLIFTFLPVTYKSFAMIRGEPYVIFFMFLLIHKFLLIILKKEDVSSKNALKVGILFAGLALSRQWGLLLYPAFALTWFLVFRVYDFNFFKKYSLFLTKAFSIGILLSSWFYLSLFTRYGSITAFNRNPLTFSFNNQPYSFYFEFPLIDIFTKPIRGFDLTNKLIPVLYSDTWGDYWGYFILRKSGPYANFDIVPYLGRVNLFSLIPTMLMLFGILYTIYNFKNLNFEQKVFYYIISSCILFTWLGYLWFLIKYPNPSKGDTIKATYILSLIQLLPFYLGNLMNKINKKSTLIYKIIFLSLIAVSAHNLPVLISRYFGIYT
jgi:hypothetical protein